MPLGKKTVRALSEIAFIVFLFYTNLLMGEFIRSRSKPNPMTLLSALNDIITPTNSLIGLVGAIVGYLCIELFRKRL